MSLGLLLFVVVLAFFVCRAGSSCSTKYGCHSMCFCLFVVRVTASTELLFGNAIVGRIAANEKASDHLIQSALGLDKPRGTRSENQLGTQFWKSSVLLPSLPNGYAP